MDTLIVLGFVLLIAIVGTVYFTFFEKETQTEK
jgi:hypothetical protein